MESTKRVIGATMAVGVIAAATLLLALAGRTEPDLSVAVVEGRHAQVRILLGQNVEVDQPVVGGFTPLMRAAVRDDEAMVRLLADGGADVEAVAPAGGLTPIHVAAIADAPEAIRALIEAGAEIDRPSRSGRRAIDHAAAAGSVDAIIALAEAGVDLDTRSHAYVQLPGYPTDLGPTPLATAARFGHVDAVDALLALGASVDGRSARGQTALLQAVAANQAPELIVVLLEAGADTEVRSTCVSACVGVERDALGWARRLASPDVVALLEDRRAGVL